MNSYKRLMRALLDRLVESDFERSVLYQLLEIPRGESISYKEMARRIGKPNAYRAVGNALHKNPIPILVPCHRVVLSDKKDVGGYGFGGSSVKRMLLNIEHAGS